jgi:pimeloyl-ACP methyl ester carboxylesterase
MLEKGREEVLSTDPATYYADLSACNNFDVMDRLHEIQCPCLIICGSDDQLTPPKYSRFMQERLPQSEVVVIEGAGHMVMLEKPDQVNEAITKFIKSL